MTAPMGSIIDQSKIIPVGDKASLAHNTSEIEEIYTIDDEELLERAKAKLGFFASTLIYLKKEFTE
jgi:hypothetical protein